MKAAGWTLMILETSGALMLKYVANGDFSQYVNMHVPGNILIEREEQSFKFDARMYVTSCIWLQDSKAMPAFTRADAYTPKDALTIQLRLIDASYRLHQPPPVTSCEKRDVQLLYLPIFPGPLVADNATIIQHVSTIFSQRWEY